MCPLPKFIHTYMLPSYRNFHINVFELHAVKLALTAFTDILCGHSILLQTDNLSSVLCQQARRHWLQTSLPGDQRYLGTCSGNEFFYQDYLYPWETECSSRHFIGPVNGPFWTLLPFGIIQLISATAASTEACFFAPHVCTHMHRCPDSTRIPSSLLGRGPFIIAFHPSA